MWWLGVQDRLQNYLTSGITSLDTRKLVKRTDATSFPLLTNCRAPHRSAAAAAAAAFLPLTASKDKAQHLAAAAASGNLSSENSIHIGQDDVREPVIMPCHFNINV